MFAKVVISVAISFSISFVVLGLLTLLFSNRLTKREIVETKKISKAFISAFLFVVLICFILVYLVEEVIK